jgi:PIF1-like helicase
VENLILAKVHSSGGVALSVASSGIAAILDGGRTSHSRLKIPIEVHAESICSISAQSDLVTLLKKTCLIIWDEAPAQHRHCFEAVDRMLKDIRNDSRWFGGVTMVFAGIPQIIICSNLIFTVADFRQCLPVVPKGSRAQIVASTIAFAPFWKDVKVMALKVNMRVLSQAAHMSPEEYAVATKFAAWQLAVGQGSANSKGIAIEIPSGTSPSHYILPSS